MKKTSFSINTRFKSAASLKAQTGTLAGMVNDATTGEALAGANVVVDGTGLGAAADAGGSYLIEKSSRWNSYCYSVSNWLPIFYQKKYQPVQVLPW
ncbi:MAG: hypothetical protein CM1200mP10_10160 [Candidatus Neomarinimicrobiota bacterium]|nr:MAG: hypothetical protein CM1200mP10_10160 [Candidatus Neomarinimicrobiota bacterium]